MKWLHPLFYHQKIRLRQKRGVTRMQKSQKKIILWQIYSEWIWLPKYILIYVESIAMPK